MQRLPLLIKLVLTALLAISSSQAGFARDGNGTFFGQEANGKWIIGVKVAQIDNNEENIKDADAIGLVLGYEFSRPIGGGGSSTIELEYVSGDETELPGFGSYEADMVNLFLTFRSAGTLYFKAKAGVSYSDINFSGSAVNASNEDVALAGGIGLGVHIGDYGVIELEYSADTGDNDLGLIGLNALLEF